MTEQVHRDYLEPAVLARLAALPLDARFPMLGNVSGRHRSPIRGSSVEFSEYRKYVPGDDTRRLDWRAYARSDRFYIKEFEADTNLRLCLIVDTSGSMQYGNGDLTKLDYARRIAGTLAYLAARQGDAVGLYCAGADLVREIPPKRNAAHLRHILDQIGNMRAVGETGLCKTLHQAAQRVQQRALIVIMSDLFIPPDQLRSAFQHLRFRKHDVALFHLMEKNELEFDFDRPVRFLDLEGGPAVLADPTVIARQYHRSLRRYLDGLDQAVRDTMVDYRRVSIDQPYADVLARFLLARTRGK